MWNWIRRAGHPDERALMLAGLEPPDVRDRALATHLAECDRCRETVARSQTLWADARASAEAEADGAFTTAVLERQRALVLKRLEQQGHPARVLRFPVSASRRTGSRPVAHRWVAAAAAAGLLVGMITGRLLPGPRGGSSARPAAVATRPPAVQTVPSAPGRDRGPETEEAFLVDLEMAAASPRIEPLHVLDAMTPRTNDGRR